MLAEGLRLLGKVPNTVVGCRGFLLNRADQFGDVLGRMRCALGQLANFVGNHRKSTAGFTRTGGFDRGVEREQVGLVGNFLDQIDDAANLLGGRLQSDHLVHRFPRVVGKLSQFAADTLYCSIALHCQAACAHGFLFFIPQAVGQHGERLLRFAERLAVAAKLLEQALLCRLLVAQRGFALLDIGRPVFSIAGSRLQLAVVFLECLDASFQGANEIAVAEHG